MKLRIFLRPLLAVVLGFVGAFLVKGVTPPAVFAQTGALFLIIAVLAFGLLGFILPEIIELAGRAGIAALARQIADLLPSASTRFRFRRRGKRNNKYPNPLIVDTSALIDGRLLDIVKTGFVFGTLLVMPSVVDELHKLADSADEKKRARGRRGLDALAQIQAEKKNKVEMLKNEPEAQTVDGRLIKLAEQVSGKVVTCDFNLNKVARVRGVMILNVNELANAVKTAVLPWERLVIQIREVGREKEQGVGYLPDGTMIVVEGGAKLIGKTMEVMVLRVLQTVAGKMIFARPVGQRDQ